MMISLRQYMVCSHTVAHNRNTIELYRYSGWEKASTGAKGETRGKTPSRVSWTQLCWELVNGIKHLVVKKKMTEV